VDEVSEGPDATAGNGRLAAHGLLAKLSWALRSEPGDIRPHNEDFAGAFAPTIPDDAWDRGPLFVVADGLGGHAAGEVASRTAVEATLASWTNGAPPAPHQALRSAARGANLAVYDAALERGRRGMATTLTALTLAGREAIVAHVGDSRCYLVRGDACSQLTADHSRVGEMLRLGLLSPEQAANHPGRSMLTRTVGTEAAVQVDLVRQATDPGDTFVLCSDGLWDAVARHEIAEVVGAIGTREVPTVVDAADRLVFLALEREAPDNVTVLVVRVSTDMPIPSAGPKRSLFRRGRR
jgi:serine/threonine protein phosphatase PrpC